MSETTNVLRDAVTLAIARADGQDWETLDDAPSRGEFMSYPAMADAALAEAGTEVGRLQTMIAEQLADEALFARPRDGESTLTGDLALDMAAYAQRLKSRLEEVRAEVDRLGDVALRSGLQRLAVERERDALRAALVSVVNALGPEHICECPPSDGECGLRDEAADALATARAALAAGPSADQPHLPVRLWQERPGEFSYVCSCGTHWKHQRFGEWPRCADEPQPTPETYTASPGWTKATGLAGGDARVEVVIAPIPDLQDDGDER